MHQNLKPKFTLIFSLYKPMFLKLGEVDSSPENQILGNISPSTPQRKETNSRYFFDVVKMNQIDSEVPFE